ncbi:hypothetical protein ACGFJC_06565 [Nonomuraea fuscirosea]|uniref:hypothetical protein n=1 Tax=Nonomuraea fuscirosea TaxID=1291556 RepID=UPI00371F191A
MEDHALAPLFLLAGAPGAGKTTLLPRRERGGRSRPAGRCWTARTTSGYAGCGRGAVRPSGSAGRWRTPPRGAS